MGLAALALLVGVAQGQATDESQLESAIPDAVSGIDGAQAAKTKILNGEHGLTAIQADAQSKKTTIDSAISGGGAIPGVSYGAQEARLEAMSDKFQRLQEQLALGEQASAIKISSAKTGVDELNKAATDAETALSNAKSQEQLKLSGQLTNVGEVAGAKLQEMWSDYEAAYKVREEGVNESYQTLASEYDKETQALQNRLLTLTEFITQEKANTESKLNAMDESIPGTLELFADTDARLTALPGELENAYSEASEAIEEIPSGENLLSVANLSTTMDNYITELTDYMTQELATTESFFETMSQKAEVIWNTTFGRSEDDFNASVTKLKRIEDDDIDVSDEMKNDTTRLRALSRAVVASLEVTNDKLPGQRRNIVNTFNDAKRTDSRAVSSASNNVTREIYAAEEEMRRMIADTISTMEVTTRSKVEETVRNGENATDVAVTASESASLDLMEIEKQVAALVPSMILAAQQFKSSTTAEKLKAVNAVDALLGGMNENSVKRLLEAKGQSFTLTLQKALGDLQMEFQNQVRDKTTESTTIIDAIGRALNEEVEKLERPISDHLHQAQSLVDSWSQGNETEQEELLGYIDSQIAEVKTTTEGRDATRIGEDARKFMQDTIDKDNEIEIERGDVVTDGEDNSPDNPYGVRRTVLLDFMKATARNVDKINQKMYEHSKANNDQRKAFLREIMVLDGDLAKEEAAMEYMFGFNEDEMDHWSQTENSAREETERLDQMVKAMMGDTGAVADGISGMLPDYSAVVAQSERQSLDTVMDAMREAERQMRTLLNGSHVAFDAVLNKTYKDQKEELSADAGEIIQDVQGAGEEVIDSAGKSLKTAVDIAAEVSALFADDKQATNIIAAKASALRNETDARALQIAHVMVNESANMDGVAAEARGQLGNDTTDFIQELKAEIASDAQTHRATTLSIEDMYTVPSDDIISNLNALLDVKNQAANQAQNSTQLALARALRDVLSSVSGAEGAVRSADSHAAQGEAQAHQTDVDVDDKISLADQQKADASSEVDSALKMMKDAEDTASATLESESEAAKDGFQAENTAEYAAVQDALDGAQHTTTALKNELLEVVRNFDSKVDSVKTKNQQLKEDESNAENEIMAPLEIGKEFLQKGQLIVDKLVDEGRVQIVSRIDRIIQDMDRMSKEAKKKFDEAEAGVRKAEENAASFSQTDTYDKLKKIADADAFLKGALVEDHGLISYLTTKMTEVRPWLGRVAEALEEMARQQGVLEANATGDTTATATRLVEGAKDLRNQLLDYANSQGPPLDEISSVVESLVNHFLSLTVNQTADDSRFYEYLHNRASISSARMREELDQEKTRLASSNYVIAKVERDMTAVRRALESHSSHSAGARNLLAMRNIADQIFDTSSSFIEVAPDAEMVGAVAKTKRLTQLNRALTLRHRDLQNRVHAAAHMIKNQPS